MNDKYEEAEELDIYDQAEKEIKLQYLAYGPTINFSNYLRKTFPPVPVADSVWELAKKIGFIFGHGGIDTKDVNTSAALIKSYMDKQADKWIPVTERLPGKPGLFLVFNGAVVFAVQFSRIDIYGDMPEYAKKNNGFDWPCQITHWQPLPSIPK